MWVPQAGTVFVKKAAAKTTTESGIHLPTEQVELVQEGEVVITSQDSYLPVGTRVMFSKFAGSEVKVDGQSLFIMKKEDVLAFWQESTES